MTHQTKTAPLSRRAWLRATALGVGSGLYWPFPATAARRSAKPRLAAIVTEYRPFSHADVIVGRLLKGYTFGVEPYAPRTQVVSMHVDQTPQADLSRVMSAHFGYRIEPTIERALSQDGSSLDVDGVVIIGEHGNYPHNEKGQHMYPRRQFFEETVRAFEKCGRSVPVFNDKHLGYAWEDARWMYDQSRALDFPLMAGSSLPTTWRRPDLEIELEEELDDALVVAYGGVESYGFHALETLQCMIERRRGGESGVRGVTCLEGQAVWTAAHEGRWSRELLDVALGCSDRSYNGSPEDRCPQPIAFLIEHSDGFRSAVLLLNGYVGEFYFAGHRRSNGEALATEFWLQEPGFGHFSYLTHNIESMFLSGEEPYPPERTLLTTGILDAAMTSRYKQHQRIPTPWLAGLNYRASTASGRRAVVAEQVQVAS